MQRGRMSSTPLHAASGHRSARPPCAVLPQGAIQATPGTEGTEDTVCTGLDDYVCEADGRAVDPSAF